MDSTLGIFTQGYRYFTGKFAKHHSDIYQTRLMLRKTIAVRGREATELFYDQQKFRREGATPKRFRRTLFGLGGVQGTDNMQHMHRKAMFMNVMRPDDLQRMDAIFEKHWKDALVGWMQADQVVLFDEVEKILARSACEWTGVPLPEEDADLRTHQLSDMIDAAGGVGDRYLQGRVARVKAEKWIGDMVEPIRRKEMEIAEDSVFHVFVFHRDLNDELLSPQVVAVEVLNLLRPIVAIARYIVFTAHALHRHPSYRNRLINDTGSLVHNFVQEVRRYYPFFPFVAAIVKTPFYWKGTHFPQGMRVLLDLYATNHDERLWENPDSFYPERFENWNGNDFDFIPQGGGNHDHNHRCAGEYMTIRLMENALRLLVQSMNYTVPRQKLDIDLSRIPALPESRFIISNLSAVPAKTA